MNRCHIDDGASSKSTQVLLRGSWICTSLGKSLQKGLTRYGYMQARKRKRARFIVLASTI